jgi:hypothetical protein
MSAGADISEAGKNLLCARIFLNIRRCRRLLSSKHFSSQPLLLERQEPTMINCLRHQLYHPAVILPALAFGQLMAELDFNMGQVAVVLLTQGLIHAWHAGSASLGGGHDDIA